MRPHNTTSNSRNFSQDNFMGSKSNCSASLRRVKLLNRAIPSQKGGVVEKHIQHSSKSGEPSSCFLSIRARAEAFKIESNNSVDGFQGQEAWQADKECSSEHAGQLIPLWRGATQLLVVAWLGGDVIGGWALWMPHVYQELLLGVVV